MIPDPALVAQALEAFDNESLVALNKPNRFFYDPVHYPLQSITLAVFEAARWYVSVFTTCPTIQWCEVHHSVSDEDGCHWDRLMGPRPGRGKCQLVERALVATQEDTE